MTTTTQTPVLWWFGLVLGFAPGLVALWVGGDILWRCALMCAWLGVACQVHAVAFAAWDPCDHR